MIQRTYKMKKNIDELIKKSNELKKELDQTPYEDEKKFTTLLRSLLKIHNDLDEIYD